MPAESLTRRSRQHLTCSAALAVLRLPGLGLAQQSAPLGQAIQAAPADPAIAAATTKISPEQIRADIAKLVTFKNRSTLSSMETDLPPGTGVLAAADWITSEF